MRYIAILVEGRTEEKFIKSILNPFLLNSDIYAHPILLKTAPGHQGGLPKYSKIREHVFNLLKSVPNPYSLVTTMFDYYKLPNDFPGKRNMPSGNIYERVKHIEDNFCIDIGSDDFLPYIQIHEFEALLFASMNGFEKKFPRCADRFKEILRNSGNNPELINDLEPPSRKIINIVRDGYRKEFIKTLDGLEIARNVGIDSMIKNCKHFREWVYRIVLA